MIVTGASRVHQATSSTPEPAHAVNVATLTVRYGVDPGDVSADVALDYDMSTFPGTFREAIAWCEQVGGELILYSWTADLNAARCEGVDK